MFVLFVCTGNTCRSPMAEKLAWKWIEDNGPRTHGIVVSSAGLAAFPGSFASEHAVRAVREEGLDLSDHRASQLSEKKVREADLILTMTMGHKQAVTGAFPAAVGKTFTLSEFSGDGSRDIPDPFGQPVDVYRRTAAELRELIEKAFHKIVTQGNY